MLEESNGGEGRLGLEPGWFQLWSVKELLELNAAYDLPNQCPGFCAFGGNGGGEMFAFQFEGGTAGAIFMIPYIPMEITDAILIAPDFRRFREAMGKEFEDAGST